MKISDEVIDATTNSVGNFYSDKSFSIKDVAQAVINAYLKDIWKPFDKDDESTWPVYHKGYLVMIQGDVFQEFFRQEKDWHENWVKQGITHYCDPADIIPEERT